MSEEEWDDEEEFDYWNEEDEEDEEDLDEWKDENGYLL